jgi:hypothetical protein
MSVTPFNNRAALVSNVCSIKKLLYTKYFFTKNIQQNKGRKPDCGFLQPHPGQGINPLEAVKSSGYAPGNEKKELNHGEEQARCRKREEQGKK